VDCRLFSPRNEFCVEILSFRQSRTLLRHCCWCGPSLLMLMMHCRNTSVYCRPTDTPITRYCSFSSQVFNQSPTDPSLGKAVEAMRFHRRQPACGPQSVPVKVKRPIIARQAIVGAHPSINSIGRHVVAWAFLPFSLFLRIPGTRSEDRPIIRSHCGQLRKPSYLRSEDKNYLSSAPMLPVSWVRIWHQVGGLPTSLECNRLAPSGK